MDGNTWVNTPLTLAVTTPDSTVDEMREGLPLVDGRLSLAVSEIVRRLKSGLPLLIEDLNAREQRPDNTRIPLPDGYGIVPARLTDRQLNHILVGFSTQTQALSPGVFLNVTQIEIYAVEGRVASESEVKDAFDRAGLIRGVLYPLLTGCVDLDGRECWRLLEPLGVTPLPKPFGEFYGTTCAYRLVQSPQDSGWCEE